MSSCTICYGVAKQHLVSCWRKKKTLRKVDARSDLDSHFLAVMRRSYKFEQIGYIFQKLSDSSEECLTWCLQFMQGIWDRIQRMASKCSISSAGSELQREREERGRGASLQQMPRRKMENGQTLAKCAKKLCLCTIIGGVGEMTCDGNFRQFSPLPSLRQVKITPA